MRKKDKLLIELIKTVKLNTPRIDFTENLMNYLKEEEQFLNDKNSVLYQRLDKNNISSLPEEFVSHTMSALENKKTASIYKPLIPRKTGIVIAVLFIACYFFIASTENTSQMIHPIGKSLILLEWLQEVLVVLPMLSMSMFVIALLVFIDFFVKQKLSF